MKTTRSTDGFTPLSHPMGKIIARLEREQQQAQTKKPAPTTKKGGAHG